MCGFNYLWNSKILNILIYLINMNNNAWNTSIHLQIFPL